MGLVLRIWEQAIIQVNPRLSSDPKTATDPMDTYRKHVKTGIRVSLAMKYVIVAIKKRLRRRHKRLREEEGDDITCYYHDCFCNNQRRRPQPGRKLKEFERGCDSSSCQRVMPLPSLHVSDTASRRLCTASLWCISGRFICQD